VVPVLHRTKRQENSKADASEIKVNTFNENIELYLNPTEGILAGKNTPVWTVKSNPKAPEGLQYEQVSWVRLDLRTSTGTRYQRYDKFDHSVTGHEVSGGRASGCKQFKRSCSDSYV